MSLGGIKAGRAFVEAAVEDKTGPTLEQIQARFKRVGQSIAAVGGAMAGIGAAGIGGIMAAVTSFASAGDNLGEMSDRLGIAGDKLSLLSHAAVASGTDLQTFEAGVSKMNKSILALSRGSAGAQKDFAALGLSIADLQGLSPDQQFGKIADAMAKIDDPGQRAALAMRIFGSAGADLAPMLAKGAAGIDALTQRAEEMGLGLSKEQIAAAGEYSDKMDDLKASLGALTNHIGSAFAPILTKAMEALQPIVSSIVLWTQQNPALVATIGGIIAGVGAVGVGLVAFGSALAVVIPSVVALVGAGGALLSFVLSPMGIATIAAVAGVALLGYGLFKLGQWFITSTEAGQNMMQGLKALTTMVLGIGKSIFQAIRGGDFKLAGSIAMNALELAFFAGVNRIMPIWLDFKHFLIDTIIGAMRGVVNAVNTGIQTMLAGFVSLLKKLPGGGALAGMLQSLGNVGTAGLKNLADQAETLGKAIQMTDDAALKAALQRELDLARELFKQQEQAAKLPPAFSLGDTAADTAANVANAISKATSMGTFSGRQALEFGRSFAKKDKDQKAIDQRDKIINSLAEVKRAIEVSGVLL